MHELNGAVLVITHSRADFLEDLFNSLQQQLKDNSIPLIVVRQLGFTRVEQVVENWKNLINVVIEMDGSGNSIADNIGRNRLAGYSVAFESLGVDWVLAVEDDVVLSEDAIQFTKFIMSKFINRRDFRGVNLGSRLPRITSLEDTYCLTRFGIFGQGAAIHKRSWNKMKTYKVLDSSRRGHWDSAMEFFMKTGLIVAPNNSRYIDRGWGGTHAQDLPEDPYFQEIKESFVKDFKPHTNRYFLREAGYYWRKDLKNYRRYQNLFYWVKFFLYHPIVLSYVRKLLRVSSFLK